MSNEFHQSRRIRRAARHIGNFRRQANGLQLRLNTPRIIRACQIHPRRKAVRQRHADGYTLAMHQLGTIILRKTFQRVAKRMA